MRVKCHECADDLTVNRDESPLPRWEQPRPPTSPSRLSVVGLLSGSVLCPFTNTHLQPRWTEMDCNPWALGLAEGAQCRVNCLTWASVFMWMSEPVIHSTILHLQINVLNFNRSSSTSAELINAYVRWASLSNKQPLPDAFCIIWMILKHELDVKLKLRQLFTK